jgi:hypothetical protein
LAPLTPPPPPHPSCRDVGSAYYFFGTDGTPEDKGKEIGTAIKSGERIVEAKAGLTRSKEDYQKVRSFLFTL